MGGETTHYTYVQPDWRDKIVIFECILNVVQNGEMTLLRDVVRASECLDSVRICGEGQVLRPFVPFTEPSTGRLGAVPVWQTEPTTRTV